MSVLSLLDISSRCFALQTAQSASQFAWWYSGLLVRCLKVPFFSEVTESLTYGQRSAVWVCWCHTKMWYSWGDQSQTTLSRNLLTQDSEGCSIQTSQWQLLVLEHWRFCTIVLCCQCPLSKVASVPGCPLCSSCRYSLWSDWGIRVLVPFIMIPSSMASSSLNGKNSFTAVGKLLSWSGHLYLIVLLRDCRESSLVVCSQSPYTLLDEISCIVITSKCSCSVRCAVGLLAHVTACLQVELFPFLVD